MTSESSQAGMFTQLEPLLAHRAVLITVSRTEGDRLQVNICPRQLKEGENPALTVPLCVTGTAAELDGDLVPQISRFVASHVGFNSNLASVEREIAEAEKAAREEAKNKKQKIGNGKKVADNTIPAAAPASSKPETEPHQTPSLFHQQSQGTVQEPIEVAETIGRTE
jgi:PRTRC genetic system protein E